MKTIVLDIEADNLLDEVTTIYCICTRDIQSQEEVQFTPDNLRGFVDYIGSVQCLIGHNLVGYDIPVIKKIMGIDLSEYKIIDTLLLSKLLNPDRPAHSLDWWGQQLGNAKIHFNDWSKFTQEMLDYCIQDVRLNQDVYNALVAESGTWDWRKAYALELAVAKVIQQQEQHGVKFDIELARKCREDLDAKMKALEEEIEPQLPQREIPQSKIRTPPKKKFKKDGTPSALAEKYFGDALVERDGEWFVGDTPLAECNTPLHTHEPMKLANQADMKEWLMKEGWKPTIWNMRTNKETGKKEPTSPKFTDMNKNLCPNLEKLGEKVSFIKGVSTWLSYRNRRNVILSDNGTGLLANSRLSRDGRLSASADTIGTNTGRFAHRVVANIPRVTSLYGSEMRSLFTVDDDCLMVGWDASGLEARIEAHYTYPYDQGAYARELLEGDVHTKNAEAFKCDRNTAKTVKYAVTYGAQAAKLASTLDVSEAEGQRIFDSFWEGNPALAKLKSALLSHWKGNDRQFIKGLDGRKVMTRTEHSVLNSLFQSGGIICMKTAMVLWDQWVKEQGLDAAQVIHYHKLNCGFTQ
jgi:DNA polymerase I-like protein with 3'-5' exonuclease and polymerase domains